MNSGNTSKIKADISLAETPPPPSVRENNHPVKESANPPVMASQIDQAISSLWISTRFRPIDSALHE